MKKPFFPILVTFDTDSDEFQNEKFNAKYLSWKGISEGILIIKALLQDLKDSFGKPPKFTWFVRADNVLNEIYGDSNYILEKFDYIWKICRDSGDEIAWHPHIHRKDIKNNWVQEVNFKNANKIVRSTFKKFKKINFSPTSIRVGGTFGSNELNKVFSEIGIKCNSSSFPGRKFHFDNYAVSWKESPKKPYYPDKTNYSSSGNNCYNTLQVPLTVLPIKTCYDKEAYIRYLDLTFNHKFIAKSLPKIINNLDLIVTISHPNIVINDLKGTDHGLLNFDINNLYNNLVYVLDTCKRNNLNTCFMTMNEFYEQFKKHNY